MASPALPTAVLSNPSSNPSSNPLSNLGAGDAAIALQPAGGPDPERFDWAETWYPVHYVGDLDKGQPTPFTLLDRDIVIWWEPQTESWRVFLDQCPHRLARLSEGRVNEAGQLECPYHGWSFAGGGACQQIPQEPEGGNATASKRACATALPCAVHQEMLFVYPGKPENAPLTQVPIVGPIADGDPDWIVLNMVRDLPYDALTLLENVLDPSHLPFTHHKSVGNRANASPVELELSAAGKAGFEGIWQEGPRRGKLGKQRTTFVAPALMWHDLTSKQFGRTLTVVYATPMRKGHCRLFARFPFKFSSKVPALAIKLTPKWFSHLSQNNILEDDQIFLHFQERYLADRQSKDQSKDQNQNQRQGEGFAKAFYLPTKADTFVTALRKWVVDFEADPFPGQPLPPAQTKEQLLDRYHSHTKHCASCRGALANLQKVKVGVGAVGAIAWSIAPLLAVLDVGLVPVGLCGGLGLGMALLLWRLLLLEQGFYRGSEVPARNRG